MVFNIILKILAYSITQNRRDKLTKKERKTFSDDNIIILVDTRRLKLFGMKLIIGDSMLSRKTILIRFNNVY